MSAVANNSTPASHRYLRSMAVAMVLYLATLFLAEHLIETVGITGAAAAITAALPGICFASLVWLFGALILQEKDEFIRLLYVRQGLIATVISMTAASIWGFLEQYYIVEHVEAFWWPTLWCFGIGIGAIFNRIKYGTFG